MSETRVEQTTEPCCDDTSPTLDAEMMDTALRVRELSVKSYARAVADALRVMRAERERDEAKSSLETWKKLALEHMPADAPCPNPYV